MMKMKIRGLKPKDEKWSTIVDSLDSGVEDQIRS